MQEQKNISYDDLMGGMLDRFAYMLHYEKYNGKYAAEFTVLEELLADSMTCDSDDHTRQEQEASNQVLVAFSKTLPSGESGGRDAGASAATSHIATVPFSTPPSDCSEKLPILTSISPDVAPSVVTRGCSCNSSPMSALPCNPESIPKTPEKILHGDIDYVKNSFFGTWNPSDFATFTGQCESAKTSISLVRQSNPGAELEPEITTLAGRDVIVNPSGVRIGKGAYYAHHLTFEGFDVFIHQDEKPKNDNPQIRFDIRAEARLNYGAYGAQQVLVDFLSQLGFTVESEKLSRLDIQVMIDVPVSAFVKFYLADHDVGGGRNFRINGKKKTWGKQIETLDIGDRKRIHLSIYDKRQEIAKKYNAETAAKYDKTIENIGAAWWHSDHAITRIEFSLGRDSLRAWGVNSLEDFRLRERAIVEYLTHKWFRLLKNPKVRGTENDAEIHPIWKRVQSLFFQYFCCADVPAVKREKPTRVSVDSERLENQGGGCYVNATASRYGKQKSMEDLRHRLHAALDDFVVEGAGFAGRERFHGSQGLPRYCLYLFLFDSPSENTDESSGVVVDLPSAECPFLDHLITDYLQFFRGKTVDGEVAANLDEVADGESKMSDVAFV